jgi:hypothetical protein
VGIRRQPGDHRGPAIGNRVELAVAVELVAKQVGEEHGAGVQLRADAVQPELVDLEQAQLAGDRSMAPGGRRQGRRHAPGHVGPRPVVDETGARALEHRRRHGRGRRLAVRGRDDRAAAGQAGRQVLDGVGIQPG